MPDALDDANTPAEPEATHAIAQLSPTVRTELAALVAHARPRAIRDTRGAIEQALSHVPGILRGAVRKLLFPS